MTPHRPAAVGHRIAPARFLTFAAALVVAGGGASALGGDPLTALLIGFAIGFLMVMANASTMVLDPHGRMAGFAASFIGCIGQLFGSTIATIVAVATAGRLVPWAAYLIVASGGVAAMLAYWRWRTA